MIDNSYILNPFGGGAAALGLETFRSLDLNNTPELVFHIPGGLYGWNIANTVGTPVYVKFYNKATVPVVGVDIPVITLAILGTTVSKNSTPNTINFTNGCYVAATTGVDNNDNTAPGTNQVVANIFYVGS